MKTTKEIKPAKLCFEHIGGKLGMLLMDTFIKKTGLSRKTLKTSIITLLTRDKRSLQKCELTFHK
jgi:hypothetical protein